MLDMAAPVVFSVDLEDWYASSLVLFGHDDSADDLRPPDAVAANTHHMMDLLDRYKSRATFFVLRSVARRFPNLIRELMARGHEIAAHGTTHRLVYRQTPSEFRDDVRMCLDELADVTGAPVFGYRAPYFSITRDSLWALDILAELGLRYDSSIFPFRRRLYGIADFSLEPIMHRSSNGKQILEIPLTVWSLLMGRLRVPVAGGGYWRVLPSAVICRALASIRRSGRPLVLYSHPYELNPQDTETQDERLGLRKKLVVGSQRLGRRQYAGRVKAVLQRFPTITLAEAYAHAWPDVAGSSDQ